MTIATEAPASPARTEAATRVTWGFWMASLWLATRLFMFVVFTIRASHIANDVRYYFGSLTQPSINTTLIEYPVPIVWLASALKWVTGDDSDRYVFAYAMAMALLDATITTLLWLRFSRRSALCWTVFLALLGPIIWFRLDLLVAVMVCLAALYVVRRPAVSGIAAAVAAALKLWPALLVLPMIGRDRKAMQRIGGFAVVGVGLGLASVATVGLPRNLSPLTWQSNRGLQVESVAATAPMLLRALDTNSGYTIHFSEFNAYEINGPAAGLWRTVADLSLLIAVVLVVGFGLTCLLRPPLNAATLILAMTMTVCLMMVTNKTFSPQYMIWLAGPLAALYTLRLPASGRRKRAWLVGMGLTCAGLTQVIYPLWYGGVIGDPDLTTTAILVARNLLVVAMTVLTTWWTLESVLRGLSPSNERRGAQVGPLGLRKGG